MPKPASRAVVQTEADDADTGPKRVVIYVRTSADKESKEEGEKSIPEQITDCEKKIKEKGWTVVDIVKEPNRSSWTYPAGAEAVANLDAANTAELKKYPNVKPFRVGLGRIVEMMEDGEVDVVFTRDQSRLMRPLPDGFMGNYIKQIFTKNNVTLWTAVEGEINFKDFAQALSSDVIGRVSSHNRSNQFENARRKIAEMRDNGEVWRIMRCYGIEPDFKGRLKIDETRAPIVQEIYDRLCKGDKGESYRGIAISLGQRDDAPPPLRGGLWTECNVSKIAKNPLYAGMMYNTEGVLIECKAFNHGKATSDKPKPIITKTQWHKTQIKIENRVRYSPILRVPKHLLSGLLKCPYCGRTMFRRGSQHDDKTRGYFYCKTYDLTKRKECQRVRIAETGLERILLALVPLWVKAEMRELLKAEQAESEIPVLEAKRDALLHRQQVLIDTTPTEELISVAYRNSIGKITKELNQINRDIVRLSAVAGRAVINKDKKKTKKIEHTLSFEGMSEENKQDFIDTMNEDIETEPPSIGDMMYLSTNPDSNDLERNREALRSIIERVEITRESVRVILKSGGQFEFPRIFKRANGGWSYLPTLEKSFVTHDEGIENRLYMEIGYPEDTLAKIKNKVIYKDDELWIEATLASMSYQKPSFRRSGNKDLPKTVRVFKEPEKTLKKMSESGRKVREKALKRKKNKT